MTFCCLAVSVFSVLLTMFGRLHNTLVMLADVVGVTYWLYGKDGIHSGPLLNFTLVKYIVKK